MPVVRARQNETAPELGCGTIMYCVSYSRQCTENSLSYYIAHPTFKYKPPRSATHRNSRQLTRLIAILEQPLHALVGCCLVAVSSSSKPDEMAKLSLPWSWTERRNVTAYRLTFISTRPCLDTLFNVCCNLQPTKWALQKMAPPFGGGRA